MRILPLLFVAIAVVGSRSARADATDTIVLASPSLALADDATALITAPARLGLLRGWNAVYTHAELGEDARLLGRGEALAAAIPVYGGVAVAAGFELLRPPAATGAADRGVGRLALAWALNRAVAVGLSYRWYVAPRDLNLDGISAWDASVALDLPLVSLTLGVRNLNEPAYAPAPVPRTWVAALGARPGTTDALTLSVEGELAETGAALGRVAIGLYVPYVGRLRADAEIAPRASGTPAIRGGVALDVDTTHVGVTAFGRMGDRLGSSAAWGAAVRLSEERYRGLPVNHRVAEIAVNSTPDPRAHAALLRKLDRIARDPEIQGVLFRPRAGLGSMAEAEEVREAFAAIRRQGKRVVCHLGETTGNAYYACGVADRILMNPAGVLKLAGVHTYRLFFRDALVALGVRAQFARIGDYKSATEEYTEQQSTGPSRAQTNRVLDDVAARLTANLGRDRRLGQARMRALLDEGPFSASEARAASLVDALVYEDMIGSALRETFGGAVRLDRSYGSPADRARRWGLGPAVAVVYVDGGLVDGESLEVPLIGERFTGARTIAKALRDARENPRVRAVVLRVDSPGGSVMASDILWREVWRTRQRKPVICSMGGVAASGGYYVASAANEIFADAATLTGSIGIFFGKFDFSGLLGRLGVGIEQYRRGRHADAETLLRPFTEEEMGLLGRKLREFYGMFLDRVARGRRMPRELVDALGQGRVYTGAEALEHRLVDRIGGLSAALARARQLGHLADDAETIELPAAAPGLLEQAIGLLTSVRAPAIPIGRTLGRDLRTLAPLFDASADTPMALVPLTPVE